MPESDKNILVFSPYMFKLYKDCPAKFYYRYAEQIQSPVLDKNFQTGKNIHALASYYLKGQDISKFENVLTPKESELWSVLRSNDYLKYDVAGVEKGFSIRIKDVWYGGRMDAVVTDGENYYVLDYKTGSVNQDMTYDYQTMIYLLACDSLFDGYKTLSFVYLDLKNNKEIKVVFNEQLKSEYIEKLDNTVKEIKAFDITGYKNMTECKCEYSKLCTANSTL